MIGTNPDASQAARDPLRDRRLLEISAMLALMILAFTGTVRTLRNFSDAQLTRRMAVSALASSACGGRREHLLAYRSRCPISNAYCGERTTRVITIAFLLSTPC